MLRCLGNSVGLVSSSSGPMGVHPVVAPLAAARRTFVMQKLANIASTKLERLSSLARTLGVEERITEPRRKFEKRHAMQETLAERLALQGTQRQQLVPTTLRVTKCKRYLLLDWQQATPPASPASAPAGEGIHLPSAAVEVRPTTRLLAEFLRSQSSSTDVIGSGVLVYGKRGLTITEVVPHGNYAVRLQFSDNHSGGIFPYDYLYHLGGPQKIPLMRAYLAALREKRKSRIPPKRAPASQRRPLPR